MMQQVLLLERQTFIAACCVNARVLSLVPSVYPDQGIVMKMSTKCFPFSHLISNPITDTDFVRKTNHLVISLVKPADFSGLKFIYLNECIFWPCIQCVLSFSAVWGTLEFLQKDLCFENIFKAWHKMQQLPRMCFRKNRRPPLPALCPFSISIRICSQRYTLM